VVGEVVMEDGKSMLERHRSDGNDNECMNDDDDDDDWLFSTCGITSRY